jgi:pilus assembly protein CpaB
MKRWQAILPIVLALVVALTTSFFIYKWLQRQRAPKEVVKVVESEAVPVIVAAVDLPWGTKLNSETIKRTPYLKESLPPGYFSEVDAMEGRVLIVSLKQNEPILETKLAPISVSTGGVSAVSRQL